MKGMVFTEFLEMVEDAFSPEMADRILDESELESGGVYTAIGTYDHREMVELVGKLSGATDIAVADLLDTFGHHLFGRFHAGYPQFFEGVDDALSFLERVHGYVHIEVRKLYPDAELPSFHTERDGEGRLVMIYESARRMADFAGGLIRGCIDHYGGGVSIDRKDLDGARKVRFTMVRG